MFTHFIINPTKILNSQAESDDLDSDQLLTQPDYKLPNLNTTSAPV